MKDCRDCKWNKRSLFVDFDECKHPKTGKFSDLARKASSCGYHAKYFEPKPPRFSWLKRLFTRPAEPVSEFDFSEKQPEMYSWR